MNDNKNLLKMSLEQWGKKTTVEFDHFDCSLDDIFDAFTGMLITISWLPCTIEDHILEMAENIKSLRDTE